MRKQDSLNESQNNRKYKFRKASDIEFIMYEL